MPPMPPAVKKSTAKAMSPKMAASSLASPRLKSAGAATALPLGGNQQVHREMLLVVNAQTGEMSYQPGMVISITNAPGRWRIERSTNLVDWAVVVEIGSGLLLDLTSDPHAFFRLTPLP